MMSVDILNGSPAQLHHLRSPSPLAVARTTPQLSVLTAIDNRSRRRRPGRQIVKPNPTRPLSQGETYIIRNMCSDDLPAVATLMKEEGWNVDFDNMAVMFDMQPQGYFVAQDFTGQIVGHCSVLHLDASVGMLSYVLVASQHQKQGLGSRLMDAAKQALGGRTMTFYSVEDAVPFYKIRNFETRRFHVLVRDFTLDPVDFEQLADDPQINVVRVQDVDFSELDRYDRMVHGMARPEYLRRWILRDSKVAFAAVNSLTGEVEGYVSASCFNGRWDVNPLYADSPDVALQLLKRVAQDIGETVRMFARIPADSSKAIKLFGKLRDISHHRILYLMSDKVLPDIDSNRVYSLATVCYGLQ